MEYLGAKPSSINSLLDPRKSFLLPQMSPHIKSYIVGTFDNKYTLIVASPNNFVLCKIITDWDVENRSYFNQKKNGLKKINSPPSGVIIN